MMPGGGRGQVACRAVVMDAVTGGAGAQTVEGWAADFDLLMGRVGPCFSRHDLRGRAGGYVRGLLGRVERKNGWQVAEYLGDDTSPTACSGCWGGRGGMPARCGTR